MTAQRPAVGRVDQRSRPGSARAGSPRRATVASRRRHGSSARDRRACRRRAAAPALLELAAGQQAVVDEHAEARVARTGPRRRRSASVDGQLGDGLGWGSTAGLAAGAGAPRPTGSRRPTGWAPPTGFRRPTGSGDGGLHCGSGGASTLPSAVDPLGVPGEEVVDLVDVELVEVQHPVPDEGGVLGRHLLERRDDGPDRPRRAGRRRGSWGSRRRRPAAAGARRRRRRPCRTSTGGRGRRARGCAPSRSARRRCPARRPWAGSARRAGC